MPPAILNYTWHENWARIPETESGRYNGRTHGVAVSRTGDVFVFAQAQPAVMRFSPEGRLKNAWGDRFRGAHGMTLVEEDGVEYLWLTDQHSAEVVKTTLDGRTLINIQKPEQVYPRGGAFVPTWVGVNEISRGGNGDIWVADGYGAGFVHRFDCHGKHIASINGVEGAGKFTCPHAVRFLHHHGRPELYVTDRGNARVQVFDADGKFLRAFGQDYLVHPCDCAWDAKTSRLIIPELFGRVAIVDANDKLIAYVGENPGVEKTAGWPNLLPEQLEHRKFNSPHGCAAAGNGDVYVVEWIVGGRITKLSGA